MKIMETREIITTQAGMIITKTTQVGIPQIQAKTKTIITAQVGIRQIQTTIIPTMILAGAVSIQTGTQIIRTTVQDEIAAEEIGTARTIIQVGLESPPGTLKRIKQHLVGEVGEVVEQVQRLMQAMITGVILPWQQKGQDGKGFRDAVIFTNIGALHWFWLLGIQDVERGEERGCRIYFCCVRKINIDTNIV